MTSGPMRVGLLAWLLVMSPLLSQSAETGDLWEVTSRMSMPGMPGEMPAQKQTICSPKDWTEPPAPADEGQSCQSSDFAANGSRYTWKLSCSGPPAMTGKGEVNRVGSDTFDGSIQFTGEMGSMAIKLDGKRLGPCDRAAHKP